MKTQPQHTIYIHDDIVEWVVAGCSIDIDDQTTWSIWWCPHYVRYRNIYIIVTKNTKEKRVNVNTKYNWTFNWIICTRTSPSAIFNRDNSRYSHPIPISIKKKSGECKCQHTRHTHISNISNIRRQQWQQRQRTTQQQPQQKKNRVKSPTRSPQPQSIHDIYQ